MALILPYRRKTFREVSRTGFYYDFETLTGKECSIGELTQLLAKLPRDRVIRWVCAITGWVGQPANMDSSVQRKAGKVALPPELSEAYEKQVAEDGDEAGIIFHRRQAWFVLQLALLVCRDTTTPVDDDTLRRTLGQCCLMASDIIQKIDDYNRPEKPDETNEALWAVASFLPLYDVHSDDRCVARAHSLWFECTTAPGVMKKAAENGINPNVSEVFQSAFGVPLEEFVMFCSLTSIFFEANQIADPSSPLLFEPDKTYPGQFDPLHSAKILSMISQTPDELSVALMSSRQSWSFDLSVLRDRPLIRLTDNQFCCPDISMLRRLEVDRVNALLTSCYPKDQFGKFFGYLFEEYIDRSIRASGVESATLAPTYIPSPKFVGKQDEVADGLFFGMKSAILFESKAARLTSRQKFAASPDEMVEQLRSKFCEQGQGGGQLVKSIKRLIAGEKIVSPTLAPVSLTNEQKFIPIVVTYEQTVGIMAVRNCLQKSFDELLSKANVDPARVAPLLILTVRDIEILAAARSSHSLEDLIHRYVQYINDNLPHVLGSFIEFMYNSGIKIADTRDMDRSMTYARTVKARQQTNENPPAGTE